MLLGQYWPVLGSSSFHSLSSRIPLGFTKGCEMTSLLCLAAGGWDRGEQLLLIFLQRCWGPSCSPCFSAVGQVPFSPCVWQEVAAFLPLLMPSVCLSLFCPCWALASSPEEAALAYVRTLGLLWLFPAAPSPPHCGASCGMGQGGGRAKVSSCCFQASLWGKGDI